MRPKQSYYRHSRTNPTSRQRPGRRGDALLLGGLLAGGCVLLAVLPLVGAQPQPPQPAAATAEEQEGIETLTSGPIHEAFASPTDPEPVPGPIVAKQPPPDVQEEPAAFKPEGDFVWIPGYWIWDDERDDFLWVTGVWRKPPPGMRFVPGYWLEVEGGWQRVPGFWVSADAGELTYRPQPPESLETGPSSPSLGDNYFWIPGTWIYYDAGYRWRGGYWSPYQPNWIWCPARWTWTPGGFVYLPGYWDFLLTYRGQMFAPVYFRTPLYAQAGWFYRPWCVIPSNNLFVHLWIRPRYGHYYYGNFYGPQYANWGIFSWALYPGQRAFYDPFYAYCGVHYRRQGIDFIGRCRDWQDYYTRNPDHRPPRTWRDQQQLLAGGGPAATLATQLVARNIAEIARTSDAPIRLTRVDDRARQFQLERVEKFKELHTARKRTEREAAEVAARLPRPAETAREAARDARGKAEDRRDRDSLLERAEDAAKAPGKAKGREAVTRDERRPAPRLTLPRDETAERIRTAAPRPPAAEERARTARRTDVPPPMPETERGKGPPERPERVPRGPQTPKARPEVQPPTRAEPKAEPRAEPREEPRAPRAEPRVEPRAEPRPEPRVEPRVEPRAEPRPPRVEPRAEPRPEPRAEPRSEPKAEPRTPRADVPRESPRPAPKGESPRTAERPPRVEAPRVEAPRVEAPRAEAPRPTPERAPRVESPRPAPERAPRIESPRPAPERAPRVESPRPAEPAPKADRPAGKGKSRDRDGD